MEAFHLLYLVHCFVMFAVVQSPPQLSKLNLTHSRCVVLCWHEYERQSKKKFYDSPDVDTPSSLSFSSHSPLRFKSRKNFFLIINMNGF